MNPNPSTPRILVSLVLLTALSLAPTAGAAMAWTQDGVRVGSGRDLDQAVLFDLGDGNSWLLFENHPTDGSTPSLRSVSLDASGAIAAETDVPLPLDHVIHTMSAQRDASGGAVVVWREATLYGAIPDLRAMVFDSPGHAAWATPVELSSSSTMASDAELSSPLSVLFDGGGSITVSTTSGDANVLHQIAPDGTRLTPLGGTTFGTDIAENRLVGSSPGQAWLLELSTAPDTSILTDLVRLHARALDLSTLSLGTQQLVSRGSETLTKPFTWVAESDGAGGFWLAQVRLDTEANARALYIEHMDANGVGRWPTGGRAITHARDFHHLNLRPLDANEAMLAFSTESYSDAPRALVFQLHGNDHLAWGNGAELVPAVAQARPQLRLRGAGQVDLLWQRDAHEFYAESVSADSLVNTFYRGRAAMSASAGDRVLLGATESGPFGGVAFWGEPNPDGTSFSVRATVDGAIPMVREPEEFAVWTVDERATVKWESLGAGELDIDLSLDDGATWQPLASSIGDQSNSLDFEVPDLTTEMARLRVRRVDPELFDISPSFRIRPLGAGYGKSVGDLRLAFDLDGQLRSAALDPFAPQDMYLLARVDFADIGQAGYNDVVGLGGWEAGITLDPKILAIETELFGPGALDVGPDPLEWSVGLSGQLALGRRWVPLMRLRVMSTAPLDRELRVSLGASTPSSFDDPGGPGLIAGWLERPASGECGGACLRAFGGSREEEAVVINPDPVGVPTLHLESSDEARIEQVFELPLRVQWASMAGDTPWVQCNATVVLENAASQLQSLRSDGPGELRSRVKASMLSFAYRAAPGQTLQGEQLLHVGILGGTQVERLRPRLLNVRFVDEQGDVVVPLTDVQASDVTREVPGLVQAFDLHVVNGIPWLSWAVADADRPMRVVARDAAATRVLSPIDSTHPSGQIHDPDYSALRTVAYALEVDQNGQWTELARIAAPTIASDLALSVEPNPVTVDSSIRFSLGRARSGRVEVFDLRGRRVREWMVNADDGRRAIAWSGSDADGRRVAAGIYFVRVQTSDRVAQQKVLIVR